MPANGGRLRPRYSPVRRHGIYSCDGARPLSFNSTGASAACSMSPRDASASWKRRLRGCRPSRPSAPARSAIWRCAAAGSCGRRRRQDRGRFRLPGRSDTAARCIEAPRYLRVARTGGGGIYVRRKKRNLSRSSKRKPSCGGRIGGPDAPGGGLAISVWTTSPRPGQRRQCRRGSTLGSFPASVMTTPP